jgi:hypothetical protein
MGTFFKTFIAFHQDFHVLDEDINVHDMEYTY